LALGLGGSGWVWICLHYCTKDLQREAPVTKKRPFLVLVPVKGFKTFTEGNTIKSEEEKNTIRRGILQGKVLRDFWFTGFVLGMSQLDVSQIFFPALGFDFAEILYL
jgi:hypothetical protein